MLISGNDLRDVEELLKQTEGTGVDVYTRGEMLLARSGSGCFGPVGRAYAAWHQPTHLCSGTGR